MELVILDKKEGKFITSPTSLKREGKEFVAALKEFGIEARGKADEKAVENLLEALIVAHEEGDRAIMEFIEKHEIESPPSRWNIDWDADWEDKGE